MEGEVPMPDQPPLPPTSPDFPDHWGFYLLQAIHRLDEKIDQVGREEQRTADGLRQEIHALDAKVEQKLDALAAQIDHKLSAFQYRYWGTLVVVIIGFVTVALTRLYSKILISPTPRIF